MNNNVSIRGVSILLYSYLIVGLIAFALVAPYYVTQVAEAQTSDRCDEEICSVKITKNGFEPRKLIVKIGATVIWTNTDDRRHTVTSGSPGEITTPMKSPLLEKSDTYEIIFHHAGLYAGNYKYFDQVIQTMRGEIIVEEEEVKMEKAPEEVYEETRKLGSSVTLKVTNTKTDTVTTRVWDLSAYTFEEDIPLDVPSFKLKKIQRIFGTDSFDFTLQNKVFETKWLHFEVELIGTPVVGKGLSVQFI